MEINVREVRCPNCGAGELHPRDENKCLIRAFKVSDTQGQWLQCLVCAGYYNPVTLEVNPIASYDENKGWFLS